MSIYRHHEIRHRLGDFMGMHAMPTILPDRLKRLRKLRNLTQSKLADDGHLNVQTVSRIERGRITHVVAHTMAQLADVLGVSPDVLSGEASMPAEDMKDPPWDRKSQMSLRLRPHARNALELVAARYRVSRADVVELSPLLFLWAAEASLRQRRRRLDDLAESIGAVEARQSDFPHLSALLTRSMNAEAIMEAEAQSIRQRDLFARALDAGFVDAAAEDDDAPNPFEAFLTGLLEECPQPAVFEGWNHLGPRYELGLEDALRWLGGDQDAAQAVVCGFVGIHEMPSPVRAGDAAGRAAWVRARHAEEQAARRAEDPDFYALLDGVVSDAAPDGSGADQ